MINITLLSKLSVANTINKDLGLMKKLLILFFLTAFLSACTSLTHQEHNTLRSLKAEGITVDKPAGSWERPANPAGAGALNILPGFGNFYLASGNGGDSNQYLYGFLNLITWPVSVIWGIPEAAIDANRINEREMIYFYTYDQSGKAALQQRGLEMSNIGTVVKRRP